MPIRAPRICGCGHVVPSGVTCACVAKRQVERLQRLRAECDRHRPHAAARGYDRAWQRVRGAFLKTHPVCCMCQRPATEVDHVETIAERPELRLKWSNLRPMCRPCHSRRTARDQGFGRSKGPRWPARTGGEGQNLPKGPETDLGYLPRADTDLSFPEAFR